jgi:general secretion pathway protein K
MWRNRNTARPGNRGRIPAAPLWPGFSVLLRTPQWQVEDQPHLRNGRRSAPRHTRGSALLAVLWLAAALAAIAFAVSSTVRTETGRVEGSADGLRAYYLASGSVERGIQWMLWGWTGYSQLNPDGTPRFWAQNSPRMVMHYPSGEAIVEVMPETAKLNINTASPDELYRVVAAVGGEPARARDIAQAIVDWRTPGSGGAPPDALNLSATPTFRPRHASFEEIEELLLVRGMTPELFYGNFASDAEGRLFARGGLRDCLSVWGSHGPYDINTASPALMEAIGVDPAAAAQIVAHRISRPFRNMGEVAGSGIAAPGLTVGGNLIWTLRATARLRRPDGSPSDVLRTSAATVKLLDRKQYFQLPLHVLRYYDDAWSELAVAPPGPRIPGAPAAPGAPGTPAAPGTLTTAGGIVQ